MPPHDRIPERLSQGLAERYRVERELGRGGMAIVYLAHDEKHRRPVAIKVLRPEIASAIGAARFLREIRIAAQLNHPHILPLYDSGESDGLLYYVMPFVPGETVRQRLERERQLPLHDSVQIGAEVASALSYAHAHDIVHRDIKPENILLSEGYALVADFGIARAITVAEDSGPVTTAGITVGTPNYMSPEQALAESLDGRSDQYSLGCVLYEMLTGRPPFGGTTAQAILAKHTLDPVPSIRAVRADVPATLEQVIGISLAKQPTDRHVDAEAFGKALTGTMSGEVVTRRVLRPEHPRQRRRRRTLSLALFTMVAGVVTTVLARRPHAAPPGPPPASASVAVIPFTNAGGGKPDYYVDGFTEDLITALRRIPGLQVAPATSSYRFARTTKSPRELGERIGAAYLVGGSVEHLPKRVRVHSFIVRTATGDTILPRTYDTLDRGTLEVQAQIAKTIAAELRVGLSAATAASLARKPTSSPEAYELYLRGRSDYEQRTRAGLERAIQQFQAAIRADSGFALAYSGLSDAYAFMAAFSYEAASAYFPQARAAAIEAVARDSLLAEAHVSLGFVALFYDWDRAEAMRQLNQALRLDSTLTRAHLFRSHVFLTAHQPDSAVAEVRAAKALEPFAEITATRMMTVLYFDGKLDEAAREGELALAADSMSGVVIPDLARTYLKANRCADAIRITTRPLPSFYLEVRAVAGVVYATCGQPAQARQVLQDLERRRRAGTYVGHYEFGIIYGALGDVDRAFREFNLAVDGHEFFVFRMTWDPMLDYLRSDPRFSALTARISLNNRIGT